MKKYGRWTIIGEPFMRLLNSNSKKKRKHVLCRYVNNAINCQNQRTTKLNKDKVNQIKILTKSKTQREIAKLYGISQSTVSEIIRNRTWQ